MVAKIRSDGTSSRSAAGEIHSALPKLRDQLQSRGRHGAPLHRETKRRRSRETLERIWQAAVLAAITQRIAVIPKARTQEGSKHGKQIFACFETQSLPSLLRCYPCSFTFYLGKSLSSIPAALRDISSCIRRTFRFWAN